MKEVAFAPSSILSKKMLFIPSAQGTANLLARSPKNADIHAERQIYLVKFSFEWCPMTIIS